MSSIGLDHFLEDFEAWLSDDQDRSEHTTKAYVSDIRNFAEWFRETYGNNCDLTLARPVDFKDYRSYLLTALRQEPSSINRRLAALRTFFKWAVQQQWVNHNPLAGIKPLRKQMAAPRWLHPRAERQLERVVNLRIRAAEKDMTEQREIRLLRAYRNRAILLLLWKAALRVSEVAALNVDDFRATSEHHGRVKIRQGKGRKARQVPLNSLVIRALRDWLQVRPDNGEALFSRTAQHGITVRGIQKMVERVGREASQLIATHSDDDYELIESLKALSPVILRHTCAKRLMDSGASLADVAEILGHENLNTTRGYVHPSSADLQRVINRI